MGMFSWVELRLLNEKTNLKLNAKGRKFFFSYLKNFIPLYIYDMDIILLLRTILKNKLLQFKLFFYHFGTLFCKEICRNYIHIFRRFRLKKFKSFFTFDNIIVYYRFNKSLLFQGICKICMSKNFNLLFLIYSFEEFHY